MDSWGFWLYASSFSSSFLSLGFGGPVLLHSWAKSILSTNIGGVDSMVYSEGVEDTL